MAVVFLIIRYVFDFSCPLLRKLKFPWKSCLSKADLRFPAMEARYLKAFPVLIIICNAKNVKTRHDQNRALNLFIIISYSQ
jgi:hypothetical protein